MTVHDPICSSGNPPSPANPTPTIPDLSLALYGSFLPLPKEGTFEAEREVAMEEKEGEEYSPPGALVLRKEGIRINEGRERVKVKVTNTGDRPIQVRLLFHYCSPRRAPLLHSSCLLATRPTSFSSTLA